MSATNSNSQVISTYKEDLVINYSVFAALSVLCYELLITFRYEYECYNFSLMYFMNSLVGFPLLVVAVFSALRVFALFNQAYVTAACTFLLGLVPVATNFYQASQVTYYYVDDPVLGSSCYASYLISPTMVFNVLCTISADIIAIAITWVKTYRHVREAYSAGIKVSFGATLLRYGTVYFIVLFVVNLVKGLIQLAPSLQGTNPIIPFTNVIPNIVLSRFLINLRRADSSEPSSADHFSRFSTPHFRMPNISSIIGNLGEYLTDDDEDSVNDDHAIAGSHKDGSSAISGSGGDVRMRDILSNDGRKIEEAPRELV
ncbi:hypothetical protein NM688_g2042 [Phlebia brevispora]|uniref:Uncharacterized protein n=1 Tax=Phlebia brevispora TaxID=194682 RepID=A0ACC1TA09_9APHY|nr:hypothetical protein NM688_g2042 [Phlebia brevispora]